MAHSMDQGSSTLSAGCTGPLCIIIIKAAQHSQLVAQGLLHSTHRKVSTPWLLMLLLVVVVVVVQVAPSFERVPKLFLNIKPLLL